MPRDGHKGDVARAKGHERRRPRALRLNGAKPSNLRPEDVTYSPRRPGVRSPRFNKRMSVPNAFSGPRRDSTGMPRILTGHLPYRCFLADPRTRTNRHIGQWHLFPQCVPSEQILGYASSSRTHLLYPVPSLSLSGATQPSYAGSRNVRDPVTFPRCSRLSANHPLDQGHCGALVPAQANSIPRRLKLR